MQEVREQLFYQLMRMYRIPAVLAIGEFLEGETATLLYLSDAKEETIPSVISDTLHLTRARVAGILSSLRKKALVKVAQSVKDRRNTIVKITEKGRSFITLKRSTVENYFDRVTQKLGDEKTTVLSEMLGEIVDAMQTTVFGTS